MADDLLLQCVARQVNYASRAERLRERVRSGRNNPLKGLRPSEVKEKYRLLPRSIQKLVNELRPMIRNKTKRSGSMSTLLQVLITLRFLADGPFYHVIADTLGVSRAAVGKTIKKVVVAICSLGRKYMKMPTRTAAVKVKRSFQSKAGMPNVLCCIDGSFVEIEKPSLNTLEYICRKGFPAINVQVTKLNLRFVLYFI